MADRDDKDWRRDCIFRIPTGCYSEYIESEEDCDDVYIDDLDEEYNDADDDDVAKMGLACPFCLENFDALGLCCHIDLEHHREARAAICPVCVTKVDTNIVSHLITQHGTILKMLCKRKIYKRGYYSISSMFKKELQDEQYHPHLKESSSFNSSSCMDPEAPFLSFVSDLKTFQKPEITTPSPETRSRCNSDTNTVERCVCGACHLGMPQGKVKFSVLSAKDTETCILCSEDQERVRRCEFVSGLLLSTIFNSDL